MLYEPDNENNLVIESDDETVYHISNSKNELDLLKNKSNNINNLSIINLGKCEEKLRQEYHINEIDSLIFIKNEIPSNKPSKKNFTFEVYEPYSKTKLNLSLCDDILINIYVPMELSKDTRQLYDKIKESGYDMFNINDPFYQDICTPFDSMNGTDITLTDRIYYIYNNDETKCQSNCQFSYYSLESQYINCSCSTNEKINNDNLIKDKFNAKKLYESFYDVLKYSNYDILKCYKIIANYNAIKNNIGIILSTIFFCSYIICLLFYIFSGINPLKKKLKNELEKEIKNFSESKINYNDLLYPPVKKKKLELQRNINNKPKIYSNSYSKNNILEHALFKKLGTKKKIIDKKGIGNNKNLIYSDYELNELEYKKARKLDRRTLFQIYIATLKREHLIFFTFCSFNDYNLLSVKLARFIFLIVGDMALNTFFFSGDSMHKLFLNYGKYNFIQQIPQITYSTIISLLIEVFLCFLSLTDKYFYLMKSNFIKGEINENRNIIKCIKLKLIIFFIFIFIFFIIYWYIISVFCGVYRNTQITFIKDSSLSFSICLIYPLLLYFVSACLRYCSLRNKKKRYKCIYNFSYIIPFF